jgi:sortase A
MTDRSQRRARTFARWLGDILLTLGVVVALLLVYQVWWTNVQSARAAESARSELAATWSIPTPSPSTAPEPSASPSPSPSLPPAPSATPAASAAPQSSPTAEPEQVIEPKLGKPFALMYIPRLKDSVWGIPVLEGVSLDELARGIGHYPGTALPGEIGNFAVAGHRATHGEPLRDIDRVRKGDRVIVETVNGWYVYELESDRIVQPDETWVIDPVPGEPDATPTEALITLTTCNPRWASYERWIWWGYLVEFRDRSQGPPPALRQEG